MMTRNSYAIVSRCGTLLLAWALLVTPVSADWRLISQGKPMPLGSGAWQVTRNLEGPQAVELKLVFFDSERCALQVVDQPANRNTLSLDDAVRGSKSLAATNGGYFTPEFTPLGLQVSQGRRTGDFEKSSLLTGVVLVRKGSPYLLWRDEYSAQSGITEVLQSGPRLVNGGAPVKGLEATKSRARTFIMTDNSGHWALGVCRSATLAALAGVLSTPKIITEFKVERALNLDGGSSTGIWWRDTSGTEHYDREHATVRNFLAVVPRK